MPKAPEVFAVIMAGGSGTRFWPASRRRRPKQFLPISGERAMIAETWLRLERLVPPERILVVTAESQIELVREALPEIPLENVLPEPLARNTAPCIAFAAHEIARRSQEDSIQIVLPSDHVIRPREAFERTLAAAIEEAASGEVLVIFGVRPDHPATGYGYIEAGRELHARSGVPVLAVERFVEKPDRARAEKYLAGGRHLWNSGMFVWRTSAIQAALRAHVPTIAQGFDRLNVAELEAVYAELPSVPIDTAVLERAKNIRMLPIDYSWSDVGSWAALPETREPDASGNFSSLSGGAALVAEDARGCVVYAENDELIALIGVRDLVVVRAGDATLVCPRDRAQDVRRIVDCLNRERPRFL